MEFSQKEDDVLLSKGMSTLCDAHGVSHPKPGGVKSYFQMARKKIKNKKGHRWILCISILTVLNPVKTEDEEDV